MAAASSGSDSESDSEPAAAAAGGQLSARENVLQIWRCAARTLQAPEGVAGEGKAAAAAEIDQSMVDGAAEAAIAEAAA